MIKISFLTINFKDRKGNMKFEKLINYMKRKNKLEKIQNLNKIKNSKFKMIKNKMITIREKKECYLKWNNTIRNC